MDVAIPYDGGVIFIKAKYPAPVSLRATNDLGRDQVIRYLDLASYHFLNHPDGVKEFYFVLIVYTDKPSWILSRYRFSDNISKGLTHSGLFGVTADITTLKGIGRLSWSQLKRLLETTRGQFSAEAERIFVDDLVRYLEYKVREGKRIRIERKQLNFR